MHLSELLQIDFVRFEWQIGALRSRYVREFNLALYWLLAYCCDRRAA
jgi:hypothetical protein